MADKEICFTGFVLDTYCIDRGTLLDNYLTESLVEPGRHSYHCLVDVERCVESGYQMLLNTPNDDEIHCRALELDEAGTNLMRDLAQRTGKRGVCTTCTGTDGSGTRGFTATVYGTLESTSSSPPLLAVTRVDLASNGCPDDGTTTVYVPSAPNCDSGSYLPFMAAHGSLMLLSWGFLLPFGVLAARFLRHKENDLWFKIHRIVQPLGLLLAMAGWIVAFVSPFDVLGSGIHDASFAHGVIGSIVMVLGLLQPINAFFRPHKTHPDDDGEEAAEVSQQRRTWEWIHKSAGYIAVVLGVVNCFIGMALAGKYSDAFFYALIISVALFVIFAAAAYADKRRVQQQQQESAENENEN